MARLPILTFHALDDAATPVAFRAAEFAALVDRFAKEGRSTGRTADASSVARGTAVAPRTVLFTFDDGYASVADACSVLAARGFRAVLYLSPALLDRPVIFPGESLCPAQRALTWSEARALASAGHEIGSHAFDHVDLRRLSDAALVDQLERSRGVLEDRLGVGVTSLAYPFGFHDPRTVRAATAVYETAVTTTLAYCGRGDDPLRLPRLDAHYLRGLAFRGDLEGAGTRAYLALRRTARGVRSWIRT